MILSRRLFLATGAMGLAGWAGRGLAEAELAPPVFLLSWGSAGTQPGQFQSPIGMAINGDDEILVTDLHNARVQKFSTAGKFLDAFEMPRDMKSKINPAGATSAAGIAVDRDGNFFVALMTSHKICVYSPAGKPIREWGKKGTGDGEFNQPGAVGIGSDGVVYVTDQLNRRVQRFTPEGKFLGSFGKYGTQPGEFDGIDPPGSRFGGPSFLAFDRAGNVWITEGAQRRVQQLSAEGKPLRAWSQKGNEPGGFGDQKFPYSTNPLGPIGICVDRQDRVWVSSLNGRVQCYTPEGKYVSGIGSRGSEPRQFITPHAMVVDRQGHLYVVDSGNQRIQKFAV